MIDQFESVACALCGARDERPFCTKFDLPIVRCARCGLVYANPRLVAEVIERRYSPAYFRDEYLPSVLPPGGPGDGAFLDARYAAPLALLGAGRATPGRLLEIGTGAGFFLKAAGRAGWDAHGLELSAEAAAYATGTLELNVVRQPAEAMPFEAGSFDAAAMFEVIEHLRDPIAVLRAAHAALKPGGRLIVSTPNLDALSRLVLGLDWAVLSPAEHLYYFTETTLGAALRAAGFARVRFERRYAFWGPHETMNARYTHAPAARRARSYFALVNTIGRSLYGVVQRSGRADGLLAIAEA